MKSIAALISVLIIILLISCGNESGVTTTETGLKYQDDLQGEGRTAKDGDLISIHFIGWIVQDSINLYADWSTDSTRMAHVIGNSYIRNQPLKYVLGQDAFIKGTDEGILGSRERYIEIEESTYGVAEDLTSANVPGYNIIVTPTFTP